jgi:hypothetical protein
LRDRKRRRPKAVVDTSVLVAGISAFKPRKVGAIPSVVLLRDWIDNGAFVWLVKEDILAEYKAILGHLGVRPRVAPSSICSARKRRRSGCAGLHGCRPIRVTIPSATAPSKGGPI